MAVVRSNHGIAPISIEEALESVRNVIVDVAKKNRTMIDYYIHPKRVPPEIAAYKPRLEILHARVQGLTELDMPNLTRLIDQAVAVVADLILPIIDQLLSAIRNIQQLFIIQYDRNLDRRQPYATVYDVLQYRGRQLEQVRIEQMSYSRMRPAESLSRLPSSSDREYTFCPYAIAFVNHRDEGGLSQVLSEDLGKEDRERLRRSGGAFLSWDCPGCAFSLKYHVGSSAGSSIQSTDDVRTHPSAPGVQYRPPWLVKCHIYQARSKVRRGSSSTDDARFKAANQRNGKSDTRRGSMVRRQSEVVTPRSSGSLFWFGAPTRSKSAVIIAKGKSSSNTNGQFTAKYGCPFCFATGRESEHMDYRNGRELAEHIAHKHRIDRAPSGLMLERYQVGIDGQCSDEVGRWDLNLGSRGE